MRKRRPSGAESFAPYQYGPIGSAERLEASGERSEFDWDEAPEYRGKTPPMNPSIQVAPDHRY